MFVAALALVSPRPARADDAEDQRRIRATFDAIVREASASELHDRDLDGPSLTALFRDLLSQDADRVVRVEQAAWVAMGSKGGGLHAPPVERVIRFLHGLPERRDPGLIEFGELSGLTICSGAVILRTGKGGSHSGPGLEPLRIPFEKLVGAAPLRPAPAPTAGDLLRVEAPENDGDPSTASWSDSALWDLGRALGEACATDDAGFDALVGAAAERPVRAVVLLALGWTGRKEALAPLAAAIRELSETRWSCPYWLTPLDAAMAALRHADAAAYDEVIRSLSDEQRCRALGEPDGAEIVRLRLTAIEAEKRAAEHREAVLRLCCTLRAVGRIPGGPDAPRLFRRLLEALRSDDPEIASAARAATAATLGCPGGPRLFEESRGPGGRRVVDGEFVGALLPLEQALARLGDDVEAGRIEYLDAALDWGKRADLVSWNRDPAVSALSRPDPLDPGFPRKASVRLTATWVEGALRLRLTNEGARTVLLAPVAFRLGRASRVRITETSKGGTVTTATRTRFSLCVPGSGAVVPSSGLRALGPRESWDCDVPVGPDLHGATDLDVELRPVVVRKPASAPIVAFRWTPVL